jgi:hypothetical protein
MASRRPRHWLWLVLMVAATTWYAWPQALYSLFPVYDVLRFLLPDWAEVFRPWIESFRSTTGR